MTSDHPALNESEQNARRRVVALCRAMLSGELSFVEGANKLCALRYDIRVPEHDADIMTFVAILGESDHLPSADSQRFWSSMALKRLEPELAQAESRSKTQATQACNSLIKRFVDCG